MARAIFCFVLALTPLTVAAAIAGPSIELFLAFASGVLFSIAVVGLDERRPPPRDIDGRRQG